MNSPWPDLLILAAVGAAAEGAALWALLRWRPAGLVARNYRHAEVVSRGGVTFAAPLIVGALGVGLLGAGGGAAFATAVAAGLLGMLGWLDDARGTTGVRGLEGHLAHLIRRREVTTGLVKAVGGAGIGLWAAYMLDAEGWRIVPAGAAIALSANAVNGLDTRPGRAAKLFLAASIAILVLAWARPVPGALGMLAVLTGAVAVFAPPDLRERVMLGDTGANPLGAVLGIAVVSITRWPTWMALGAVLLAFSLAADRWSLTAALDRLARRRTP